MIQLLSGTHYNLGHASDGERAGGYGVEFAGVVGAGCGDTMVFPRFGIKLLLIVIALIALWLSTLYGYVGSNDIQAFVWTAIVVMSGVAAIFYQDRRRAFWLGFFGTLLLVSERTTFTLFGAKLTWTQNLSRTLAEKWQGNVAGRGQLVLNINTTLILFSALLAAAAIGFLCVLVYDHSRKTHNK